MGPGSRGRLPLGRDDSGVSFDRLRIDRAAGAAGDNERRTAEEELVDLVLGAILGEFLEIENLAHAQPQRGDHDPVPRLVCVLGLVRAYLAAPGVGVDRGDLFLAAPVTVLEFPARGIAARVTAPVVLGVAALH